jgi:hypothetical protein
MAVGNGLKHDSQRRQEAGTGLRARGFEVRGFEVRGFEVRGFEVRGFEVRGFVQFRNKGTVVSRVVLLGCVSSV